MASDYPWYELVSGPVLAQGDILVDCLAPLPPALVEADARPAAEPGEMFGKVIVLTQSCDLADAGATRVMVCPVYPVSSYLAQFSAGQGKQKDAKANLLKGRMPSHLLLNSCGLLNYESPHLVTDFRETFSIPLPYASALAGGHQRVRLLPPYREYLAQAFARYYMRIGLPIAYDDIA